MEDETIKQVRIKFMRSNDYRIVPVSGVWGGVNATGNVTVDFFSERALPPDEITLQVNPPDTLIETSRTGEKVVREVMFGIDLRPDIAYSIGKWLIEHAKKAGVKEVPPQGA